ncbi:MAG: glycogen/starch/alpha-glucan phosphorylase [Pseudomonadales bacterium]|jgi:starch phosphorylase|nr:glycogen/starch/alpha-glucan phosphorylase [Pseudomonadales bacterium]
MNADKNFVDDHPWLGMDTRAVKKDLLRHYHLTLGRTQAVCGELYLYQAAALTVRDRLVERWASTRESYQNARSRRVAYLSLEYLMGRALNNALLNLDMEHALEQSLRGFGCALEEVVEQERDAGLGNGGLGRLAACFLDSCATLSYPVTGYGIRYDYGIFHQKIRNGYQVEVPDHWLESGTPWEIVTYDATCRVKFGGHTQSWTDEEGRYRVRWVSDSEVLAVPHDVPVPGYRNATVNTLRLWRADATERLSLADFNSGDYADAVHEQNVAEQISMVLYPNDVSVNGKVLRLRQQYFLSSASLQDVVNRWHRDHGAGMKNFADKNRFQLNDTHPAVAVPELMRILIDEKLLDWDEAWAITVETMAYTNHTLLPEALERWPVALFRQLLPRILEIICEINARFLQEVARHWPGDEAKLRDMSIIEEGPEQQIRMAYLAVVGSSSVNGVAALHTQLLKAGLFKDFYELWPRKFNNKTNGVTPRRWLAFCNPGLKALLDRYLGTEWVVNLDELRKLETFIDEKDVRHAWRKIKYDNKTRLAALVKERTGIDFDPAMLFEVQVKRIHEYKRQLLNVLHVIHLYDRIRRDDTVALAPRCVLIGGKAAPGYFMAKLIIKLVNSVAAKVNNDPLMKPWLRVVFLPNYQVTAMEKICAGTDLSVQISTAGKEASGTGNMKFMMNGAVTIGTLDGANIEIRESVGAENFFAFGLNAAEVQALRCDYRPNEIIAADEDLTRVMALLESGHFSHEEPNLFRPLTGSIRDPGDPWLTAADFRAFVQAQKEAAATYLDVERWTTMSMLNTARSGYFSSDRTIREYARDIWGLGQEQSAAASLQAQGAA